MTDIKTDALPLLRIKFEDGTGKTLAPPIEVRIPTELSLRIATMHLLEYVPKRFKSAAGDVLKAMGFK